MTNSIEEYFQKYKTFQFRVLRDSRFVPIDNDIYNRKPFSLSDKEKDELAVYSGMKQQPPEYEYRRIAWFLDLCDMIIHDGKNCLILKCWVVARINQYKDKTLNKLPIEEIKVERKVQSLFTNVNGVIGDIWKHDGRDGLETIIKIYWYNDNISEQAYTDNDGIILR